MARAARTDAEGLAAIQEAGAAIAPLHEPIRPPGKGDWLRDHPEPGQTFADYRQERPVLPAGARTTLYIQPLGSFEPAGRSAIEAASDLLGRFYSLRESACSAGWDRWSSRRGQGGGTRTRGTSSC